MVATVPLRKTASDTGQKRHSRRKEAQMKESDWIAGLERIARTDEAPKTQDRVSQLEGEVNRCIEEIASLRNTIASQKAMLHDKDVEIRTLRSIIKG